MTEEQQKAIDACKDQAAKDFKDPNTGLEYVDFDDVLVHGYWKHAVKISDRAMQLYGEQCRKESAMAVLKRLHGLDDYDTSSVLEEIRKEIEH